MITRRRLLGNLALGTGAIASAGLLPSRLNAAPGQLTFVSWGGTTQDAQKAHWADPFSAKSGIKVLQDGPTDYGKIKAMVESGNVVWDVVDAEGFETVELANAGLLEPIDYKIVDKSKLDPNFSWEYGVGSFLSSFVIGYNKKALNGKTPESWADLFDTAKFPGKRTFWKWISPGALEIALLADGVPASKLYPLDVDRAFAKLDKIKKDIIWWGSGAESQQQLVSGEAPLGMFWNGRIFALQEQGEKNVDINWHGNITLSDIMVVPKGTKNKEAAMQFLALASSPKPQAAFADATAYAPINSDAIPLLGSKVSSQMPFAHKDTQITPDLQFWGKNLDAISARWYKWQTG